MSRRFTSPRLLGCAALLVALMVAPAHAQARFSGMVFADAQDALHSAAVPADSSTFRFRRVQFTVDEDLDSVFAVRLQLEADNDELTSKGKFGVFVKQAWLRWSHLGVLGDLYMGLATTPTWSVAESYWGYRSLEKTVLDLQGLGVASDLGVSLLRSPAPGHALGWHLMLSNGSGQKPENNASKKLALSLPYRFGDFVLEGMGDFEGETGPRDKWTVKLLGGWQKNADAAGVEAFRRVNAAAGVAGADVVPEGVSAFAHRRLNDHWRAVARVDWFDPDHERSHAGYREMVWLAALDAMPHPNVHVMPNVLVRSYAAKDAALPDRKADVTLRVTLHWNYK